MTLWYRVFGRSDALPAPTAIQHHLASLGLTVAARFAGDEEGWFRAELAFGDGSPLCLERFLADEEGIRAELNSWAAFLETCDYSPHSAALMERAIQTRQLFTLRKPIDQPDEVLLDRLCTALCRHLAGATDGFYQADGQGFFEADGNLLVHEY
jgi:hypothetical protein